MIVSINQPAYLPWLGYFHRIASSNLHIVLDHVQFEKNSFINRNKVKGANGACWLTVPVQTKGKFGNLPIHSVLIDRNNRGWMRKHWQTILHGYRKSSFFHLYSSFFEEVYDGEWSTLIDLCDKINCYILDALSIDTKIIYSSQMNVEGSKDELILNLCQQVNADVYLSGSLGRNYLDVNKFLNSGIQVVYQDYEHPSYSQCFGNDFEPYLSIIDLMFNHGVNSREILMLD